MLIYWYVEMGPRVSVYWALWILTLVLTCLLGGAKSQVLWPRGPRCPRTGEQGPGGARAGACLPADGWAVSHYGRLWGCSGLGLMSTCRQVGLGAASSLLDGPTAQGSRGWYLLTDGWSWVPGLVWEEKSDPVPSSGQWLWALGVLRQPASCWVGCPGPPSSPPVGRHQLQDHCNPAACSARTA